MLARLLTMDPAPVTAQSGAEERRKKPSEAALQELGRALEVLRSKLHTLKLAHSRIEREAEKLAEEIERYRA